ncbi:SPOR domain-containing protein [Hydrogenophaga sp. MI9]|uniref:SPOR domain-containing protein n=1 Tax=Hydrogenophaga sp. MI9 TaxID=3453719 RepID=UPI003EEFFCBA
MLRMLAIALLVGNLAFFAWSRGSLAGLGLAPAQQHEPERLKAQIEPQTLRLLNGAREDKASPAPAPAEAAAAPQAPAVAAAPAQACWQAGGFTLPQADALRVALAGTGLATDQWQLSESRSSGRWVVYMGRYNDEQMQKKKAELRELKIEFREVSLPSTGPGLALGTFSSEEAVQQALKDVAKKGVRSARAAVERPEVVSMTLRLPAITDEQRSSVEGLGDALAGKKLQPCE